MRDIGSVTEPVRFADILSTASAIANYLGAESVTPSHMLDSIAILQDEKSMEDLAPPNSPFVAARQPDATVAPAVQDVVRRWFDEIERDINTELSGETLARFVEDLRRADSSG